MGDISWMGLVGVVAIPYGLALLLLIAFFLISARAQPTRIAPWPLDGDEQRDGSTPAASAREMGQPGDQAGDPAQATAAAVESTGRPGSAP